jgi:hypothetical protein
MSDDANSAKAVPSSTGDDRDRARETDASHEMRHLLLDEDLVSLVEGSDTAIAHMMVGRVMDTISPVPGTFTILAEGKHDEDYDFSFDGLVAFEDADGPGSVYLTLFGTRDGDRYEWKWADLSRRTPRSDAYEGETRRIAGILHVIIGYEIRKKAGDKTRERIEALSGPEGSMAMQGLVEPARIVLTGDDENVAFVMPVKLNIATAKGTHEVDTVFHGTMDADLHEKGGIAVSIVTTRI